MPPQHLPVALQLRFVPLGGTQAAQQHRLGAKGQAGQQQQLGNQAGRHFPEADSPRVCLSDNPKPLERLDLAPRRLQLLLVLPHFASSSSFSRS